MADGTRTKRPRRKPVDPATAAKADRIIEEVRAWYRRGQKAVGISGEGAQHVGQALCRHSAPKWEPEPRAKRPPDEVESSHLAELP